MISKRIPNKMYPYVGPRSDNTGPGGKDDDLDLLKWET